MDHNPKYTEPMGVRVCQVFHKTTCVYVKYLTNKRSIQLEHAHIVTLCRWKREFRPDMLSYGHLGTGAFLPLTPGQNYVSTTLKHQSPICVNVLECHCSVLTTDHGTPPRSNSELLHMTQEQVPILLFLWPQTLSHSSSSSVRLSRGGMAGECRLATTKDVNMVITPTKILQTQLGRLPQYPSTIHIRTPHGDEIFTSRQSSQT